MAHIPEDDDFMNASAEEWSKPKKPPTPPQPGNDSADRWGASIPDPSGGEDASRWGSEPMQPTRASGSQPAEKKSGGSKWWIILIVVVVVICLCVCLALVGLPLLGVNLIQNGSIQF